MQSKSTFFRLVCFAAMLFVLAGCDERDISNATKAARARAAADSAFTELTAARDVHSGLVLAAAPKSGFRYVKGQIQGSTPETLAAMPMRIASISKTFTATLVLQLAEEGRLNLDQPIGELLTDADMPTGFSVAQLHARAGNALGERITVRQLLNHTSGLADVFFDDATAGAPAISFANRYIFNLLGLLAEDLQRRQWQGGRDLLGYYFVQKLHEIPFGAPGAAFHYSDTNYFLLGLIIERATAQPLTQAYRTRIFDPLGLNTAVFEWYEPRRGEPMPHYINLQVIVDAAGPQLPQPLPLPPELANADVVAQGYNTSFDWAGGGLLLSANDLDVFFRALLQGKLFRQAGSLASMQTFVSAPGGIGAYGLGLMRADVDGRACYGHGGAWGTQVWYCPERDLSLVFASNQLVNDPEEASVKLLAKLLPIFQ